MWKEKTESEIQGSNNIPFLGTGWGFPPEFDRLTTEVSLTAGDLDIRNSLVILLSTMPGERKVNPKYGIDLSSLLFENLTPSLQTRISDRIRRGILTYEPRIKLNRVSFEMRAMEGLLNISIDYTIRTTNTRTNLVYPFYLKEGTDI